MADTIYTRALAQAAAAQGSTQALATLLNVPENTLLRWMSGRAQMPLRGFLRVVELVSQHEKNGGAESGAEIPRSGKLRFAMGELLARCARCDATEFVPSDPGQALRMTSELTCASCGERVMHGDLISQLAAEAVQQSRAMTVARNRRQAGIIKRTLKSSP
jgi:DNA-directed RNA polymerase subunit RPC12/RpoP